MLYAILGYIIGFSLTPAFGVTLKESMSVDEPFTTRDTDNNSYVWCDGSHSPNIFPQRLLFYLILVERLPLADSYLFLLTPPPLEPYGQKARHLSPECQQLLCRTCVGGSDMILVCVCSNSLCAKFLRSTHLVASETLRLSSPPLASCFYHVIGPSNTAEMQR